MSEKPIIFSTDMIKAILAGRKTQTRRVIKPELTQKYKDFMRGKLTPASCNINHRLEAEYYAECAKYKKGDILWVRETWSKPNFSDDYAYKADFNLMQKSWKWKPSIHMPKEAARIFLKVTGVRAERLREISEEGAKAEGVTKEVRSNGRVLENTEYESWKIAFVSLWDKINEKRGLGWDSNCWVWVAEFERVDKDGEKWERKLK